MEAKDLPKIAISLSIIAFVVAYVGWPAINGLSNGATTTSGSENINVLTYPSTILLAHQNLISFTLSNETWNPVDTANNYSVNLASGTITTTNPSNLTNNTQFTASYTYGQVDSGVSTLGQIVVGIMFFLAVIIYIFVKIIGIDII